MAENQQVADDQQAEQQPLDYEEMSTEELEKRLREGEGLITERDDFPPPPVEPEPAQEAVPEVEPVDDVPEVVEETVQAEEAPAEEAEFDERQSYIDELKVQLEQAKNATEKQEMLHGLRAGEVGALRDQMQQLQHQNLQPPVQSEEAYGEQQAPQYSPAPSDPVLQTRLAELEDDSRTQGLATEYNAFIQQHPDAEGMMEKMAPTIQQELEPYKQMQLTAKSVRKVLRIALGSAYSEMQLQNIRDGREQALQRKASQVPDRKKTKLAANISGSGGAPAPKAPPKRTEDMTAEEADAALIEEYGDGHHRRRVR